MKALFISLFCLIALSGCESRQPISVESQGDYQVELLFEKDGCKVYRFTDYGRNVYWSNCAGRLSYTTGDKSPQEIQTEVVE